MRAGDPDAFAALYDRWFDRAFDFAYRIVGDRHVAVEVARDAFLTASRVTGHVEDADTFGVTLLRLTRRAALDRPRAAQPTYAEDPADIALLWAAADALGERDREVLDLSLRHGLAPAAIGEIVGVNEIAAGQIESRVRHRFPGAVGAGKLWHGGRPACPELRAELVAHDAESFGSEAIRVTNQHAATCDACTARKQLDDEPETMFAAIPFIRALAEEVDDSGNRRSARGWFLGAAATAAVALFVVLIGVAALRREPKPAVSVAALPPSTTSTITSSTSSSTTATSTTTLATTTTTVAPPVVLPATTRRTTVAPTTTTTVAITSQFAVTPKSAPASYPMTDAPTLSWSATNVASAHVEGAGIDASKTSGSVKVCPGTVDANDECTATPASYEYTFDAFDAHGTRVVHRTVTLTIQ